MPRAAPKEDLCVQIKASTDTSRIVNLLSAHIND